jgi:hypothetical protein
MDFLLKTTILKFDHFISLNDSMKDRVMTPQKIPTCIKWNSGSFDIFAATLF